MFEAKAMLYLYVETPLHAGSGTSLGVVDLPVQRERVTYYPMVQASGIKGKLRAEAYEWPAFVQRKEALKQNELLQLLQDPAWQQKPPNQREQEAEKRARKKAAKELGLELVFGPETDEASDHAGALSPGDARLLLFPVRSLIGVFAWTTSKDALARFCRDAKTVGLQINWQATGPEDKEADLQKREVTALVAPDNDVTVDGKVVLEEFAFDAQEDQQVKTIAEWLADNALPQDAEYAYWRQKLPKSLVILPENAFRDFTQFSTEVINRIRLEHETKTVAEGALWSEEHLPTDTLLYAPLFATRPRVDKEKLPKSWQGTAQEVLDFVKKLELDRIQLGGDETVGRGLVKLRIATIDGR